MFTRSMGVFVPTSRTDSRSTSKPSRSKTFAYHGCIAAERQKALPPGARVRRRARTASVRSQTSSFEGTLPFFEDGSVNQSMLCVCQGRHSLTDESNDALVHSNPDLYASVSLYSHKKRNAHTVNDSGSSCDMTFLIESVCSLKASVILPSSRLSAS